MAEPHDYRAIEVDPSGFVAGAILIGLLVVAIAIAPGLLERFRRQRETAVVAYLRAGEANTKTQIKYFGEKVGQVGLIGRPIPRVRLELVGSQPYGSTDAVTLGDPSERTPGTDPAVAISPPSSVSLRMRPIDDPSAVDGELRVRVARLDSIVLERGGSGYSLRLAGGSWMVSSDSSSADWLLINGLPLDRARQCKPNGARNSGPCLRVGDRLSVRGLEPILQWGGVQPLASYQLWIDTLALRKKTAPADTTMLTGASRGLPRGLRLVATGALGIGKQGLRLDLPSRPALWVSNAAPFELVTTAGVGLEQLKGMLAFLGDADLREATPTTRWEDLIVEIGRSAENVRQATAAARSTLAQAKRVSDVDGGEGMVGRLALSRDQGLALQAILDTIPGVLGELAELAGTAGAAIDSTGRGIRRLAGTADTTVAELGPTIDSTLRAVTRLADSLETLSPEIKQTLRSGKKGAKTLGLVLILKLLVSSLADLVRL